MILKNDQKICINEDKYCVKKNQLNGQTDTKYTILNEKKREAKPLIMINDWMHFEKAEPEHGNSFCQKNSKKHHFLAALWIRV